MFKAIGSKRKRLLCNLYRVLHPCTHLNFKDALRLIRREILLWRKEEL